MEGGKCKISKNSPMERASVTNVSFRFAHFQLVFVLFLASFCKTCETRHMFNRMRNKYCEWTHFNVRRTYYITRRDRAMGCGRRHAANILFYLTHGLFMFSVWLAFELVTAFSGTFYSFVFVHSFVRCLSSRGRRLQCAVEQQHTRKQRNNLNELCIIVCRRTLSRFMVFMR